MKIEARSIYADRRKRSRGKRQRKPSMTPGSNARAVLTMAKKFKAGEKVRITYQGEEMEAVVIDHADNTRVWVRSHGGHGRALGYKAKDVRHA